MPRIIDSIAQTHRTAIQLQTAIPTNNEPTHQGELPDSAVGPRVVSQPTFNSILDSTYIQQIETATGLTDTIAAAPEYPDWQSGHDGVPRQHTSGNNSGLLTILTLIFVALALNFRHCPRIFANFAGELLSVRRRANVFDEHTTNESRVLILLLIQYVAYLGILLYALVGRTVELPSDRIFHNCSMLMGIVALYYLLQLCAYNTVGYVFSTSDGRRQWLRGFNASQAFAGIALAVPALISIFYPNAVTAALAVAGIVYFIARVVFIIKGFRIFFTGISSLLYFILYLCTLEIIPLILIYRISLYSVSLSPLSF